MAKKKQKVSPPTSSAKSIDLRYNTNFHYVLLFAGSLLLYGWTTTFDYSLDDDYILTYLYKIDNSFTGMISIFKQWYANSDYRPVTILSFWLERLVFHQINASTSHLVNVMLFGVLLLAIYKFVMVSKFTENEKALKVLALLTCVLFLLHPNHVSVVANIKSRDNLLSMLFGILSSIQLIKLFDLKQYWRILLCIIFLLLGLLSKLDAYSFIFLPALVILFYRNLNWKKIILILVVTYSLFISSILIRELLTSQLDVRLQNFVLGFAESPLYKHHAFTDKLSLGLTSFLYYLKFLFIPDGYYFYFGYDQIPLLPLFSLLNILSASLGLGMLAAGIYLFRKNRIYIFSFLFFCVAIVYALNIFNPVAGIVMDRYNFIPSLAFCLCLSSVLIALFKESDLHIFKNKWVIGLFLLYGACTFYRTSAWKNSFTLFDRDLPHLTRSVNANRIAAGTYIHIALEEEMKPGYDKNLTDSFITKGGRYAYIALQINDSTAQVWELLGLCDLYRKDYSTALERFRKCYAVDTTYLSGINYLGFTYWDLNQLDSAYYYFNYVMARESFFNYSANNMIDMLTRNNRKREADSILLSLRARYPDDTRLLKKIEEVNKDQPIPFHNPN